MENNKHIMENKTQNHGARRVFFDILRDTNSTKYSLTQLASFVGLLLLSATVIISLIIMIKSKTIDHVLIVELIGFVLTLLGYKNSFGFKDKSQTPITNTKIDPYLKTEKLPGEKIDDTTDDSIKH
jgi:steroid 5-alpha reductase family enzyme